MSETKENTPAPLKIEVEDLLLYARRECLDEIGRVGMQLTAAGLGSSEIQKMIHRLVLTWGDLLQIEDMMKESGT